MNKFKETLIAIFLISVIASVGYLVYKHESGRTNRELAKRMAEISPKGRPPETIEGLKQAIALYEEQIERNVREGAQTGVYWKILATRLADRDMHRDALQAFERAIYYNSEDPGLYYLTGVSAARVAKSIVGFSTGADKEREHFYTLAENSYKRALDLDPTYTRPMYGLGILYTFELEKRAADAITYMERYMSIQQSDISAMFVLARAYYMNDNFTSAIEQYDRIIARTKDAKVKEEAAFNRDIIQGAIYERR
jgi:tetratricopeptide (TPR) repeat protein